MPPLVYDFLRLPKPLTFKCQESFLFFFSCMRSYFSFLLNCEVSFFFFLSIGIRQPSELILVKSCGGSGCCMVLVWQPGIKAMFYYCIYILFVLSLDLSTFIIITKSHQLDPFISIHSGAAYFLTFH